MSFQESFTKMTGIKFHGTWLSGVMFILTLLYSQGKLPIPAFSAEVQAVEQKVVSLKKKYENGVGLFTRQNVKIKLDLKTMERRLNEVEKVNAVKDQYDQAVTDKLQQLSSDITVLREDIRGSRNRILDVLREMRARRQ